MHLLVLIMWGIIVPQVTNLFLHLCEQLTSRRTRDNFAKERHQALSVSSLDLRSPELGTPALQLLLQSSRCHLRLKHRLWPA